MEDSRSKHAVWIENQNYAYYADQSDYSWASHEGTHGWHKTHFCRRPFVF